MDSCYTEHDPNFADKISSLCFEKFKKLPKTGKPQSKKEWTLLAGIVFFNKTNKRFKVVTLCTGTKCLGFSQLTKNGNVVFDSHAEVLVRRALIRYIYYHMFLVFDNKDSEVLIFDESKNKFQTRPEITFHLFISHVPCGDAAIFPKLLPAKRTLDNSVDEESAETEVKKLKMKHTEINVKNVQDEPGCPISSVPDIYRTGAKCVDSGEQDPKRAGENFHVTGVLRTKPGRGDPTWSMSCSDKIALWNICGLQGALLSLCLQNPIYLASITFGKCPLNKAAVERAVVQRLLNVKNLPFLYKINQPKILQSNLSFEFSKENLMKENENAVPCSSSIIWCDIPNFLNVSVNGRKQGITKKNMDKPHSRIGVCKSALFENFLSLVLKDSHKILKL
uniref:tRNA-specific adenosine deaminase 1 n=1 Tax=Parasteatoda tepidariorum TaxID=114398 RepID=A0A2L2YHZ0_PARTP